MGMGLAVDLRRMVGGRPETRPDTVVDRYRTLAMVEAYESLDSPDGCSRPESQNRKNERLLAAQSSPPHCNEVRMEPVQGPYDTAAQDGEGRAAAAQGSLR